MVKKSLLRNYARLIAKRGVNIQKGQEVIIDAALDYAEFVKMLVRVCYQCGAKKVTVNWSCQELDVLNYRFQSEKTLSKTLPWEEARLQHYVDTLPCRIYLDGEDPDGLKSVNRKKLASVVSARRKVAKPYRDKMENRHQWCIAAVPGEEWAKKLFPKTRGSVAQDKLWKRILSVSRVTEHGDAVAAWKQHNKNLADRCAKLNSLKIESLHYTAPNGTDFTVGMIPGAVFCGGEEKTVSGVSFNPNIPSEECFISPMRGKAEGTVVATMPLCWQGSLIEDFSITFKEGRAVEWHARKNEELLGRMINLDEGSAYLGECALVPYESPVRETGMLFYNTLFDENAACHLALGFGFPDTIPGYQDRSQEECHKMGVNDSTLHVDFMIGCRELDITATCANGETVQIFKNGTWAF
ncbi:MAG: aminopeptidase [Clostridia bacterium]|nr:aminopeptidase [Clostridia bacterium]